MKKSELVKLLKFLNSYYQEKFKYPKADKSDNKMLQETWYMFLKDYDYNLVRTATKKLVIKKEWPPTPGEIVKEMEKLMLDSNDRLTAGEAWNKVLEAIRKYGTQYNRDKVKEMLPELVMEAVKGVGGLQAIGMSNMNETYMMSQFKRSYNSLKEREDDQRLLPNSLKKDIQRLSDSKRKYLENKEEAQ